MAVRDNLNGNCKMHIPYISSNISLKGGTSGTTNEATITIDTEKFSKLSFRNMCIVNSYSSYGKIYADDPTVPIYQQKLATGSKEYEGQTIDISAYDRITFVCHNYNTTQPLPSYVEFNDVILS